MLRIPAVLLALTLVVAACGIDSEPAASGDTTADPVTTTTDTAATTVPDPEPQPDDTTDEPPAELGVTDGWELTRVGAGAKPVLALDGDGAPAIAWIVERLQGGFVAYAAAAEEWTPEEFVEGYFYGPIGLDFDTVGDPHIVYHDHQASAFREELGDLTHAVRQAGSWTVEPATDEGHDGWDSTIAIGADGVVRAAGIDPQQFGRQDGVEYYERGADGWEVTAIGSGPVEYEWNVSLAVGPSGEVGLTYFDNNTADLVYARLDDGAWQLETVASDGDVGRFSSLAYDSSGTPHISFFDADGLVLYATTADGAWVTEEVGRLDDVVTGHIGARRITAIDVGADEAPQVVFGDRRVVRHAVRNPDGWQVSDVLTAGERDLGQQVSFELGPEGTAHIATYEGSAAEGSNAEILYLTTD